MNPTQQDQIREIIDPVHWKLWVIAGPFSFSRNNVTFFAYYRVDIKRGSLYYEFLATNGTSVP
jgi:hypothetical protein